METKNRSQKWSRKDDSILQKTSKVAVYCITNILNGKRYIGKSVTPWRRWKKHIRTALNENDDRHLYRSIRLYGVENFTLDVLHIFDIEDEAFECEHKLVTEGNLCDSKFGYNNTSGGRGGTRMSEETRQKQSRRMRENNPLKGKRLPEETRKKISNTLTGRKFPHTEEWNKKIGDAQRGRKFTDEHRQKLREAKLRHDNPHRGRKRSEETRQKMREAWKRRKERQVLNK